MATRISSGQCFTFTLMWLSYAGCYLLRKPFGIIKDEVQKSLAVREEWLGFLDFAFAIPYSLTALLFSFVGDKFGDRYVLGVSLLGTGVFSSFMGMVGEYYQLCSLVLISGAFQALCWPSACSILTSWFSEKSISSLIAIYSTCMVAGSISSTILTVKLESISSWRNVFLIPSIIVGVLGITVLLFGRAKSKIELKTNINNDHPQECDPSPKEHMSVLEVLRLKGVPFVSLALFFNKGLRAAIMFWLPIYLTRVYHFDLRMSGLVPIFYEVGGLLGSVPFIIILDKHFNSSDITTCVLANIFCTILFIIMYFLHNLNHIFLYVALSCIGLFSNTAETLLCGSLPCRIGDRANARTSVVGVINGVGSLGIIVEGPLIAYITSELGMASLMPIFAAASVLCLLCNIRSLFQFKHLSR